MDDPRKAADAAHRRIDDVDKRVVRLEAKFDANDKKLDEVSKDVKELGKTIQRSGVTGGVTGGGSLALAYILYQMMLGGQ